MGGVLDLTVFAIICIVFIDKEKVFIAFMRAF